MSDAQRTAPEGAGGTKGNPVQLVEVSCKTAASVLSQPTSPNIPVLSSPQVKTLAAPDGEGPAGEEELPPWLPEAADWEADEDQENRGGAGAWHARNAANGAGNEGEQEYEVPEGEFDPRNFIGDWTDNIGHRIVVTPAEQRGGGRRRGKGRNGNQQRISFLAIMYKVGVPEKRFTINKDRWGENWTCGNGCLVFEKSSAEAVVWETADGRTSSWSRTPPEGAVFFDPPPGEGYEEINAGAGWGEPVYYMVPEGEGMENSEWQYGGQWVEVQEGQWVQAPLEAGNAGEAAIEGGEKSGIGLNPNASEFVPGSFAVAEAPAEKPSEAPAPPVQPSPKLVPAGSVAVRQRWGRTPTPSPMLGPMASPGLRPQQGPRAPAGARSPAQGPMAPPTPTLPPAPPPPTLQLSEESPDVKVEGAWLEWSLPDPWAKLSRFPKDFCITSPMFGVRAAANMQLAFYPNGSRTAEAGLCTVSLTRGPDSAGIKFEFLVNGRGIGPKVCLGRRYLGDYPKPYGDSEESKDEKVVVRMQVLKIL